MKYILFIFSVLLINSCTFTSKTHEPISDSKNIIPISILSDTKDHVCGMTIQEGAIADTFTYNGKVYGFCATGCKDEFSKNPEKYITK